jgi:hypothetical protein
MVIVVKTDFNFIKNAMRQESTGIADDNLGTGGFCRSLKWFEERGVRGL